MLRLLGFLTLVAATVIGADLLFRVSLLHLVRPVIVEPSDGQAVVPPVVVRWEGPREMHVTLRYAGRASWDLGIRESPFEVPRAYMTDRGLYSVEIQSTTFGAWISASRSFSADGEAPVESKPPDDLAGKLAALEESLQDMRDAQEDTHDENTNLYEENAAIREENAILTEELQRLAEAEQRVSGQAAALEREYARLAEENRLLFQELAQTRARLDAVVPCTVWGYFAHLQPVTFPPSGRTVTVSDNAGEVFRTRRICERIRAVDQAATSVCFCVGSSFGG